jgi:Flp pilus assembly protein TadG
MFRPARRLGRNFVASGAGVSAVEFAVVAPLFLLILIGIVIYGLYFGTALTVSQIAAESARASVAGLDDTERAQLAVARADEMIAGNPLIDPGQMDIETAAADETRSFAVTLSYDASNLPIFGFSGLIPTPSPTIVRTSSVQRGGFQ